MPGAALRCARPPPTRRRSAFAVAACLLFALAAAGPPALTAPYLPKTDDEILERLPFAPNDPLQRELQALRLELARRPQDLALAVRVAHRYAELGRVTGDPRYSSYAQAAVAPWWEMAEPPSEVLLLRATLRQRVHSFDPALADLALLLRRNPRDGQARLTRATILQVQGAHADAAAECAALRRLAEELVWATCSYGVAGVSGKVHESYDALKATLDRNQSARPEIRAWVLSLLAEMAARAGRNPAAERHFREALAIDPADHYLLGAYADWLLDQGRAGEVATLLRDPQRTDALLLRYTLALKATSSPDLATHVEQLRARFEASRMRGDRAHAREEARFELELVGDAAKALSVAKDNWAVQKEPADLRLLLEAGTAANDAATLAVAREWIARTGMQDEHLSPIRR